MHLAIFPSFHYVPSFDIPVLISTSTRVDDSDLELFDEVEEIIRRTPAFIASQYTLWSDRVGH